MDSAAAAIASALATSALSRLSSHWISVPHPASIKHSAAAGIAGSGSGRRSVMIDSDPMCPLEGRRLAIVEKPIQLAAGSLLFIRVSATDWDVIRRTFLRWFRWRSRCLFRHPRICPDRYFGQDLIPEQGPACALPHVANAEIGGSRGRFSGLEIHS